MGRELSPTRTRGASNFVLGFRLLDRSLTRIRFGGIPPPLGMDFENQTPVRVTAIQPYSAAEKLGVQTAWEVISINEKNVQGMDFLDVFKLMKSESQAPEP